MRKTILLLLIFVYNYTFSQNQDAEIFFNDGSSLEGYAMIHKGNKIKFRISLDEEPDIWTDLMVKGIVFFGFEMSAKYEYVTLEPNGQAKLLKVLSEGNVNLYAEIKTKRIFFDKGMYNEFEKAILYLKKSTEKYPTSLNSNFRRKSKEYFSNCIGVMEKLETGEFRKSNANEMVDYYNDFCAE